MPQAVKRWFRKFPSGPEKNEVQGGLAGYTD